MVVVCMSSTYNIYMVYPQQQRSELNVRSACYPGPILRGQKNGALDFNTHSRVDSYYSPRGKSRSTPITAHIHTAQKKICRGGPKTRPQGENPVVAGDELRDKNTNNIPAGAHQTNSNNVRVISSCVDAQNIYLFCTFYVLLLMYNF